MNELNYWREVSTRNKQEQAPNTSHSSGDAGHDSSHVSNGDQNDTRKTASHFPVDTLRGWLEPSAIPTEANIVHRGRLSSAYRSTDDELGSHGSSAKDMLGAVSKEDIIKLTQLTKQLPESPRKPRKHHRHRSVDERAKSRPSHTRTSSRTTSHHQPIYDQSWHDNSISKAASANDLSGKDNGLHVTISSPPQASQSTPSSSASPTTGHSRRSWYKAFIKRDKKGKGKATADDMESVSQPRSSMDSQAESPLHGNFPTNNGTIAQPMMRDGSRSSTKSNNSSNRWRWTSTDVSSSADILRRMASLHSATNIKGKIWPGSRHRRVSSTALSNEGEDPVFKMKRRSIFVSRRHSFDSTTAKELARKGFVQKETSATNAWLADVNNTLPTHLEDSFDIANENVNEKDMDVLNPIYPSNNTSSAVKSSRTTSVASLPSLEEEEDAEEPEGKILLFDYDSVPERVQKLLTMYEDSGKLTMKTCKVVYRRQSRTKEKMEGGEDDEEEEGDEEEDGEEEGGQVVTDGNIVNSSDIISSLHVNPETSALKKIAKVHVARDDKIKFIKLIELEDEEKTFDPLSPIAGEKKLANLCVSLWPDSELVDHYEEHEEWCVAMEQRLEELQSQSEQFTKFLDDARDSMARLSLDEVGLADKDQQMSSPALSSDSSSDALSNHSIPSLHRTPSVLLNNIPFRTVNPFEYRLEEFSLSTNSMVNEVHRINDALTKAETMLQDVHQQIKDSEKRMDVHVKDIPASHYVTLKQMELDIEAMVGSRAKNAWMDAAYMLLSYLLTAFALSFWIFIRAMRPMRRVSMILVLFWTQYIVSIIQCCFAKVKNALFRPVLSKQKPASLKM